MRTADTDIDPVAESIDQRTQIRRILVTDIQSDEMRMTSEKLDNDLRRNDVADRLMRRQHTWHVGVRQDFAEIGIQFARRRDMGVPDVEGIDLRGIDADALRHVQEIDHLTRRAGFHAHGTNGSLSLQRVDRDRKQLFGFGRGQRVPFAATAAADIYADSAVPQFGQMPAQSGLIDRAILGERGDADGEDLIAARVARHLFSFS